MYCAKHLTAFEKHYDAVNNTLWNMLLGCADRIIPTYLPGNNKTV